MVQQIHSLRASGVMSSQAARASGSHASAFRKSAGKVCATPSEIRIDGTRSYPHPAIIESLLHSGRSRKGNARKLVEAAGVEHVLKLKIRKQHAGMPVLREKAIFWLAVGGTGFYSSRSRTKGSRDRARSAGIHVAATPSRDIARTTPARTSGSRGVA
jgi:hypothetical protein